MASEKMSLGVFKDVLARDLESGRHYLAFNGTQCIGKWIDEKHSEKYKNQPEVDLFSFHENYTKIIRIEDIPYLNDDEKMSKLMKKFVDFSANNKKGKSNVKKYPYPDDFIELLKEMYDLNDDELDEFFDENYESIEMEYGVYSFF